MMAHPQRYKTLTNKCPGGPNLFNSQKWFTCNFSLQNPFIIQQTGNENTWTYQLEVVILI